MEGTIKCCQLELLSKMLLGSITFTGVHLRSKGMLTVKVNAACYVCFGCMLVSPQQSMITVKFNAILLHVHLMHDSSRMQSSQCCV